MIRKRSSGLLAGVVVIAIAGAGCRSVVHAGAAATIGSHRISAGDLAKATEDLYQGPGALSFTRPQVQQYALNAMIEKVIYDTAAADLKVSPPPIGTVDETISSLEGQLGGEQGLIQAAAQNQPPFLLSPLTIHGFFTQQLLQQALAAQLIHLTPPPESVLQQQYSADVATYQSEDSSFIVVKTEDLAKQIKGQLDADPSKFAALAKQYSLDTATKDNGGSAGNQPRGTFDTTLEDAIFAAKDGTIIGPVKTQLGYYVVKVGKVTNVPYAQARAQILQQIETLQAPTYGQSLLSKELLDIAAKLDVHVNARFGSWSAQTASVGADLTTLSTPGSATAPAPTAQPTPAP